VCERRKQVTPRNKNPKGREEKTNANDNKNEERGPPREWKVQKKKENLFVRGGKQRKPRETGLCETRRRGGNTGVGGLGEGSV